MSFVAELCGFWGGARTLFAGIFWGFAYAEYIKIHLCGTNMRIIGYVILVFSLLGATALGALFFLVHAPWVSLTLLEHQDVGRASILLDHEGNEWARFQVDRRKPISLHEVPQHVIHAFIATEDRSFFSHAGISVRGIMRSLVVNALLGRKAQGASTITQQLVRLLFFDQKKTIIRKIKEQFVALALEKQCSKEMILETYLNNVYFGCGVYGIEAASERFWGKRVSALTIDQAATLAGILRCPAHYSPLMHPDHAQARRNVVLKCMEQAGFITTQQFKHFSALPLSLAPKEDIDIAPHVKEHLRIWLEDMVGRNELYTGGLIIKTTLNKRAQIKAQELFKKHLDRIRGTLGSDVDGALVSLDVTTGGVRALIGGYNFKASQFNRAWYAQRQVGSTIKPLIYSVALEQGIDFTDIAVDEPLEIEDNGRLWAPHNFDDKFEGSMTLGHALAVSKNTIAIKTLMRVGVNPVVARAQQLRLAEHLDPYLSLALGCVEVPAVKMAGAFNAFSNKGVYVEPHLVEWVKDRWGTKIWKYKPVAEPIMSWRVSSKLVQGLTNSFEYLKRKNPWLVNNMPPMFGKSGTTNQCRTCWFAGGTPDLTTVAYVGRDNNESLGKEVYPLSTVLPLWIEFNAAVGCKQSQFDVEPTLQRVHVDALTGKRLSDEITDQGIWLLV
jgi:penicillin-binding protein 1A